jgi:hypothetical protein
MGVRNKYNEISHRLAWSQKQAQQDRTKARSRCNIKGQRQGTGKGIGNIKYLERTQEHE